MFTIWDISRVKSKLLRGVLFSESEMCFSNLKISKKKYSKKLSWTWNLNFWKKATFRRFLRTQKSNECKQFSWQTFSNEKQSTFSSNINKRALFQTFGDYIVAPIFRLLSYILQILATCLLFHFAELCKVWGRLDNISIRHFTLKFFVFVIYQSKKWW